jgi:hypothetical protein
MSANPVGSAPAERVRPAVLSEAIPPWIALLLFCVLWIPQYLELAQWVFDYSKDGVNTPIVVSLFIFDGAILLLAGLQYREIAARIKSKDVLALLALALVATMTLALALHPTIPGLVRVLRVGAAFSLGFALYRASRSSRSDLIVGALAVVTLSELVVSAAEIIRLEPLGLSGFGERSELTLIGFTPAASGTFHHPYYLAAFSLIVTAIWIAVYLRRPGIPFLILIAASAAPTMLTYSRAAGLAAALVVGVIALGAMKDGRLLAPWLALLVGLMIPFMLTVDGWRMRADLPLDYETDGRVELANEGVRLIEAHPLLGVGPSRYGIAVTEELGLPYEQEHPVHNVPMLIAAENGVPGGLIALAVLATLGFFAYRGGFAGTAVFVAYIPFLMLDHFAYSNPQGLAITAVWGGGIASIMRARSQEPQTPEPTAR